MLNLLQTVTDRSRRMVLWGILVCAMVAAMLASGCASTAGNSSTGQTMTEALSARPAPVTNRTTAANPTAGNGAVQQAATAPAVATIAVVNNRPLPYAVWINLLKRSHGLPAFQYILGVELARQAAEAKGIVLTEDQLEQALKLEIASVAGPDQEAGQQQRVLQAVLARRGITMDEFRLLSRRNTYLRRIVEPIVERSITDEALKAEFDRLYGEKVQIRHIQLADGNQVLKAKQALDEGMDFAEAARKFSQNLETAGNGGELPAFSKADPAAPAGLRELAFAAEVGKVAGPVRVEGWSHLIRVEARIPVQQVEYEAVATQVRQSLKEQLVLQEMQKLLKNMLQSAVIQVQDPDLNREFQALRAAGGGNG